MRPTLFLVAVTFAACVSAVPIPRDSNTTPWDRVRDTYEHTVGYVTYEVEGLKQIVLTQEGEAAAEEIEPYLNDKHNEHLLPTLLKMQHEINLEILSSAGANTYYNELMSNWADIAKDIRRRYGERYHPETIELMAGFIVLSELALQQLKTAMLIHLGS